MMTVGLRRLGGNTAPDDPSFGHKNRFEEEIRAEILNETFQVANYIATAHLVTALTIAFIFWGHATSSYLIALNLMMISILLATVATTFYYRKTLKTSMTNAAVERGLVISKILAFAVGLSWATMAAYLIPHSESGYRLVAVFTTAVLISGAYVVGPVFEGAVLLVVPVVAGALLGLLESEFRFGFYISVMLVTYAIFVLFSTRRMSVHSYQRIFDRIVVNDQTQTIGLLLNDFEAGARDWLWETDEEGRLRHVPSRMASTLCCPAESLYGVTFKSALRRFARSQVAHDAVDALMAKIAAKEPFHDQAIILQTVAGQRWLSLNGKPFFGRSGRFAGYRGVGSDTTRSREAEARVGYLASHDPLTGLPNRAAFQEAVARACDGTDRSRAKVGLLYLDLDHFKAVNDRAGHGVGDRLLKSVAQRLLGVANAETRVFRLAGDEFAVLHACTECGAAERLAARIIAELSKPYRVDGVHLEIGASIGIAYTPDDASEPDALLSRADLALYEAKAKGKGRWLNFDVGLEQPVLRRRQLDERMRHALANGEMTLHYQPLVSLATGRVVGFEALLRWFSPNEGWISPSEIIPIAESTAFVTEIGRWALRRACEDALAWPGMRVAINVSSIHFRTVGFCGDVQKALIASGLSPHLLEVEITESILLDRDRSVLYNLRELRAMGVRIALDDFGTGYSSLSYLAEFPFDKLKIDRSFVRCLDTKLEARAIVEAITRMADALSIEVTVEGIETAGQLEFCRLKRCGTAQGFYYSGARPAPEIPELIRAINRRSAETDVLRIEDVAA